VVTGYRLADKRSKKGIREELRIFHRNATVKEYEVNWMQHLNRMEKE
jgi:hypothetical protein